MVFSKTGKTYSEMTDMISHEDGAAALTQMVRDTLNQSQNCAQTAFAVLQRAFDLDGAKSCERSRPSRGLPCEVKPVVRWQDT